MTAIRDPEQQDVNLASLEDAMDWDWSAYESDEESESLDFEDDSEFASDSDMESSSDSECDSDPPDDDGLWECKGCGEEMSIDDRPYHRKTCPRLSL